MHPMSLVNVKTFLALIKKRSLFVKNPGIYASRKKDLNWIRMSVIKLHKMGSLGTLIASFVKLNFFAAIHFLVLN